MLEYWLQSLTRVGEQSIARLVLIEGRWRQRVFLARSPGGDDGIVGRRGNDHSPRLPDVTHGGEKAGTAELLAKHDVRQSGDVGLAAVTAAWLVLSLKVIMAAPRSSIVIDGIRGNYGRSDRVAPWHRITFPEADLPEVDICFVNFCVAKSGRSSKGVEGLRHIDVPAVGSAGGITAIEPRYHTISARPGRRR